jgi:hypothetical protein
MLIFFLQINGAQVPASFVYRFFLMRAPATEAKFAGLIFVSSFASVSPGLRGGIREGANPFPHQPLAADRKPLNPWRVGIFHALPTRYFPQSFFTANILVLQLLHCL